jgi:hypothetical protein
VGADPAASSPVFKVNPSVAFHQQPLCNYLTSHYPSKVVVVVKARGASIQTDIIPRCSILIPPTPSLLSLMLNVTLLSDGPESSDDDKPNHFQDRLPTLSETG